jgi:guanylate kinase
MNQLKYRSEFEDILANYKMSNQAQELLTDLKLIVLSGPSAAGRNTIIDRLVQKGGYKYIVSDTTRKPRTNNGIKEKNGVTYWFRSEEEILDDLRNGNFLEAEIIHNQQVSGISIRELSKAYRSGKVAVNEVEIGGFNNILTLKPGALGIFVLPPNFIVWMERLFGRNKMPEKEIANRLETGMRIFKAALNSVGTHIIINNDLEESAGIIDDFVHQEKPLPSLALGHKVAAQLLVDTEAYLKGIKS